MYRAEGLKYLLVLLVLVVNREQTILLLSSNSRSACLGAVHPVESLPYPPLPGETNTFVGRALDSGYINFILFHRLLCLS